ncbi:MAG TPA: TlpA disulfide reductase family protein [Gemmatimonadaceae bacterium]|nr:TlpA disulfide reductase family protein [Gemmatimonadaceae bacterium]
MTFRKQIGSVLLGIGFVVALLAAGRTMLRDELSPVGIGAEAPDFTVYTLGATPARKTLADYRGQVLLINIWATWCVPCRVEMPSIEQLHRAYAPRGLKVLAVSVDDPGTDAQVQSFVKEFGLTFEVLRDPKGQLGDVSRDYQTSGYPETVIVGRDGLIRKKLLGAHDWNSQENRALIERLLNEKAD